MLKAFGYAALFCLSFACCAQTSKDAERYARVLKDREELLTLFRSTPRIREIDRPDVIQFIDEATSSVFLVTKEGHPAHPAMVTRQVIEKDGQLFIKMDSEAGGSEAALKTWINYMAAEDKRAVDAKKRQSQPAPPQGDAAQ